MASDRKPDRPRARLAKGFRDVGPDEIRGLKRMLRTIEGVYESYGFEPVEQPFVEYTEALGKFLPDQDRPNAGVFSFQDDEQWLSLRYDLTAPLARYVAENQQSLPTPYRSYRQGWVFRDEKPGPGRFRQFMQFDADTVGSASPAADAEVCMMAADTMEALGIGRGQYVINISSRKVLDGLLESIGVTGESQTEKRLSILRTLDKRDRLNQDEIRDLLGVGRKDSSGDYTVGAGLSENQIDQLLEFVNYRSYAVSSSAAADWDTSDEWFLEATDANELGKSNSAGGVSVGLGPTSGAAPRLFLDSKKTLQSWSKFVEKSAVGIEGINELKQMLSAFQSVGYGTRRTRFFPGVVRGLEYYTGPVFECELLIPTNDEDGRPVRFGSVGGGGRYDDLVARFTGQAVPATGFSLGVSRLYSALKLVGKAEEKATLAPIVVLVLDKDRQGDYQKMVMQLRAAGVRAEMYVGTSGMKAQMKYADKRGAPLVVIQGGDEKAKGEVQIKDLALGAKLAAGIESREEYAGQRLAQFSVKEEDLVAAVKKALNRQ